VADGKRDPGKVQPRLHPARHHRAVRRAGGRHWQGDQRLLPQHRHQEFLSFLRQVAKAYLRVPLHLACGNSGTHIHPDMRAWPARHPRITLHFTPTPTSGSWLNLVFFSIITRRTIRRGGFTSVTDLIAAIENFIDGWNDRCHPLKLDQDRRRDTPEMPPG
jgi:hypothetical protein